MRERSTPDPLDVLLEAHPLVLIADLLAPGAHVEQRLQPLRVVVHPHDPLRHREALMARVDALVGERERVLTGVRSAGWRVPDAQGNFLWFPAGDATDAFVAHAADLGVAVRPFGAEGIRVSIGEPEANDRVVALARATATG